MERVELVGGGGIAASPIKIDFNVLVLESRLKCLSQHFVMNRRGRFLVVRCVEVSRNTVVRRRFELQDRVLFNVRTSYSQCC